MSEGALESVAWSTNIAWSHDVDEILGTHSAGAEHLAAQHMYHRDLTEALRAGVLVRGT